MVRGAWHLCCARGGCVGGRGGGGGWRWGGRGLHPVPKVPAAGTLKHLKQLQNRGITGKWRLPAELRPAMAGCCLAACRDNRDVCCSLGASAEHKVLEQGCVRRCFPAWHCRGVRQRRRAPSHAVHCAPHPHQGYPKEAPHAFPHTHAHRCAALSCLAEAPDDADALQAAQSIMRHDPAALISALQGLARSLARCVRGCVRALRECVCVHACEQMCLCIYAPRMLQLLSTLLSTACPAKCMPSRPGE